MATFEELGLGEKVMSAVNQMGYTEATPVQEQAIPLVLEGNDVIAAADRHRQDRRLRASPARQAAATTRRATALRPSS